MQAETKLVYGWVIGISVRFGDKYQVKNMYAWVKMIKGGKGELHEHPTCVIFLTFYVELKKEKKNDIQIHNFIHYKRAMMALYRSTG